MAKDLRRFYRSQRQGTTPRLRSVQATDTEDTEGKAACPQVFGGNEGIGVSALKGRPQIARGFSPWYCADDKRSGAASDVIGIGSGMPSAPTGGTRRESIGGWGHCGNWNGNIPRSDGEKSLNLGVGRVTEAVVDVSLVSN
jgi:hypothetical protein